MESATARRRKPARLRTSFAAAGICLAAAWSLCGPASEALAQGAAAGQPPVVVALGRIEPVGGIVTVAAPSADRLEQFAPNLVEGKTVKAGEALALLYSRKLRMLEVETAKMAVEEATKRAAVEKAYADAMLAETRLALDQAERTQEQDLKALEARLLFLREAVDQSKKDYDTFLQTPSVSQYQKDQQRLLYRRSEEEYRAAADQVERLKAVKKINQDLAAAKRAAAEASRERLLAALDLGTLSQQVKVAEAQLPMTEIRSPSEGTILKLIAHPGEGVSPATPVLQLADLSKMSVMAEVDEADVWRVQIGAQAEITSDAFPLDDSGKKLKFQGTVSWISRTIAANRVRGLNPAADSDLRVFEVRILLEGKPISIGGQSRTPHEIASRMISLQVKAAIGTPPETKPTKE